MTQTLSNFFRKAINAYRQHVAIKETVQELRKLTDKELNDIGINRGDIYSIARMDVDMKRANVDAPFNPNMKGFV